MYIWVHTCWHVLVQFVHVNLENRMHLYGLIKCFMVQNGTRTIPFHVEALPCLCKLNVSCWSWIPSLKDETLLTLTFSPVFTYAIERIEFKCGTTFE